VAINANPYFYFGWRPALHQLMGVLSTA